MGRGKHPNSRRNLRHDGPPLRYGEPKLMRSVRVTETGWEGLRLLAQHYGVSISELFDRIGHHRLVVEPAMVAEQAVDQGLNQEEGDSAIEPSSAAVLPPD